jgi:hypothetical protein
MVLSDNETYTELAGCSIVCLPDYLSDDELDHAIRHADGYYCFDEKPEMPSNNDFSVGEVELQEEEEDRRLEEYNDYSNQWFRRNL